MDALKKFTVGVGVCLVAVAGVCLVGYAVLQLSVYVNGGSTLVDAVRQSTLLFTLFLTGCLALIMLTLPLLAVILICWCAFMVGETVLESLGLTPRKTPRGHSSWDDF